jgi:hypothetical protein
MSETDTTPTTRAVISRRGLLTGGLAGAGTMVLAGCASDPSDVALEGGVWVARVGRAPVDDPGAAEWDRAAPTVVTMDAQTLALPFRAAAAVQQITVRALHDGSMIAFRLDWDDAGVEEQTVRVDDFRDACAVLLAAGAGVQELRPMGSADSPATLLQWKADWQRDMDDGIQGAAEVYPNRSIDVYPPIIADVPRDLTPADYVEAGATEWLPGLHVGNPLSAPTRPTCVEKLIARGFGTSASAPTQNARGRSARADGGWRTVIAKPLVRSDPDELELVPGGTYTAAFALWAGGEDDAGGRKTPSKAAYRLMLEA